MLIVDWQWSGVAVGAAIVVRVGVEFYVVMGSWERAWLSAFPSVSASALALILAWAWHELFCISCWQSRHGFWCLSMRFEKQYMSWLLRHTLLVLLLSCPGWYKIDKIAVGHFWYKPVVETS